LELHKFFIGTKGYCVCKGTCGSTVAYARTHPFLSVSMLIKVCICSIKLLLLVDVFALDCSVCILQNPGYLLITNILLS